MPIRTAIIAFALPTVLLTVGLFCIWRLWRRAPSEQTAPLDADPPRHGRQALMAGVFGLPMLITHFGIMGFFDAPRPNMDVNDRLTWITLGSLALGVLSAWLPRRLIVRLVFRAAVSAAACWGIVHALLVSAYFTPMQGWLWIGGVGVWTFIIWSLLARIESREPRGTIASLTAFAAIGAPTIFFWSVGVNAQFLGALTIMLGITAVLSLWRSRVRLTESALAVIIPVIAAHVLGAYLFGVSPPVASGILLAAAPATSAVLLIAFVRNRALWLRLLIAIVSVAIPACIAFFLAWKSATADPYLGY